MNLLSLQYSIFCYFDQFVIFYYLICFYSVKVSNKIASYFEHKMLLYCTCYVHVIVHVIDMFLGYFTSDCFLTFTVNFCNLTFFTVFKQFYSIFESFNFFCSQQCGGDYISVTISNAPSIHNRLESILFKGIKGIFLKFKNMQYSFHIKKVNEGMCYKMLNGKNKQ